MPPAQPASGAPPRGAPAYGAAPSGAAPSGSGAGGTVPPSYPGYGYGQAAPYGVPAARKTTNGMAVASLVCGCVGFIFFLPAILAIIFGFVARSQIRRSHGSQGGEGLALAGIICGFAWIALFVVIFALSAANTNTNTNSNSVVDHVDHVALVALGGLT